jgi:hypothetical protein
LPLRLFAFELRRRRKGGKFTTRQTDVGRSLSADRRLKAKTIVKKGEGDRGDRRSPSAASGRIHRTSRAVSRQCPRNRAFATIHLLDARLRPRSKGGGAYAYALERLHAVFLFGRLRRWTRDRGRDFAHLAAFAAFLNGGLAGAPAGRAVVTPAASSWRTLPWRPRALPRTHGSARDPGDSRRPRSTSTGFLRARHSP